MNNEYTSPFSERYAGPEMKYLFSPDKKFSTWRRLWIALAESEMELGLPVTQKQVDQLKEHIEDINYEEAKAREKIVRHDVMSHVYAYGLQCPDAAGIIHLGATSCYVGDNTDIILMRRALLIVEKKLTRVIRQLADFAEAYREMLPRIICIVPEESMIGTLLSNQAYQHVVKSTAVSIIQHDGFSWQVLGPRFVEAEKRSDGSYLTETTLKEWLRGMKENDRRLFVSTLFGLLEATGAQTIPQIKQDMVGSLANMKKMMDNTPKEDRDAVWAIIAKLLRMGGENVWQEAKKGLNAVLESIASREKEKLPEKTQS